MYYEFYIDVFAAENFLLDICVLLVTGWILKKKPKPLRLFAAGILGSAAACIPVFVPAMRFGWAMIALALLVGGGMVGIVFGFSRKKGYLKSTLVFFGSACLMEGIFRVLVTQAALPVLLAGLCSALLAYGVSYVWDRLKTRTRALYEVTLLLGEKKVRLTALRDTGNQLYDPVKRRPVSIGDYDLLKELLLQNTPVFLIPYHSIGRSRGILPGFLADRMVIRSGEGAEIFIEHPVLALSREPVSRRGGYQMLLHPDLAE